MIKPIRLSMHEYSILLSVKTVMEMSFLVGGDGLATCQVCRHANYKMCVFFPLGSGCFFEFAYSGITSCSYDTT